MIISSECVEFSGRIGTHGYGQVCRRVNGKWKHLRAHRVAYAEVHGAIPDGMCVCHKCDKPSCVNVDHLFLGTHTDNMRDMAAKGRGNSVKGSKNGRAKLTEQDIPRIRDMLVCGCSLKAIGEFFGVSKKLIVNIKHGKAWAHVA